MMKSRTHPSNVMFIVIMLTAIIITLSSPSWLFMWLGFEINLMSFIPLISSATHSKKLDSMIMYFLVQAIGSILFLTAAMMNITPKNLSLHMPIIILISAIMFKMGAAPCHWWLPVIINYSPWNIIFMLLTMQKISPLLILSNLMSTWSSYYLVVIVLMNATVGALGGINMTSLRMIITYSSINHTAWLITSMNISNKIMYLYFIIYSTSLLFISMMAHSYEILSAISYNTIMTPPTNILYPIFFIMLSLGGLPPFLGFIPKWFVISFIITDAPLMAMILITASSISILYYLLIIISSLTNTAKPWHKFYPMSNLSIYMIMISLIPSTTIMMGLI